MATPCKSILVLTATLVGLIVTTSLTQAEAVRWRTNVDAAKVEAAQSGKLVLLHFWSTSCGPCKKLDSDVFSQPQLGDFLEMHYVPVKINTDHAPALANAYQISRVPSDIVLTPQGNVVASLSCPMDVNAYGNQLGNVAGHYRQTMNKPAAPTQPPVQAAYAGLEVGKYQAQPAVATTGNASGVQPASAYTNNPFVNTQPQAPAYGVATQAAAAQQPAAPAAPPAPQRYMNPYAQQAQPANANVPPTAPQQTVAQQQPAVQAQAPQQTQPVAEKPGVSLPPGSPPVAFEGYCPVTLKSARKWVAGDVKFGAVHRGRTFLFTGEAQRQQFLANPDSYSPVFSGYDAVLMLDDNKAVEGSRRFGFEYRGAFYLFSSKHTMDKFASDPDKYSAQVRQAMSRLDGNLGSVIRR